MQITNTDLQQSFNAIFRSGKVYAEAQVRVLVQKQGTGCKDIYSSFN